MDSATASPTTTFELIGPLQARVMAILWADARVRTVQQVHDRLNAQPGAKQLAYTTVLTVMRNLARRGLVSQERGLSRSHDFMPLVNREGYQIALVRFMRDTFFDGKGDALRQALRLAEG